MTNEHGRDESLKAARQKYLQLGREIEDRDKTPADLAHTHSKLGIFLAEVFGPEWSAGRQPMTDDRCICAEYSGNGWDGPDPDCPIHGRSLSDEPEN